MSVPVLVVEFTKQTAETVRALFWVGNRLEGQTRVLSLGEIAELTAKAAWYDVGLGETELRGLGARLYRWLDGDDRLLTNLLEGLPGRPAVVSLAIVAGETGLGSLPWELLHDGAEWCHARPSLALVPVRCSRRPPDAKTAQSAKETSPPANRPLSLLFMAASPQETSQRLLDYEREEALTLEATDQIGAIELRVEESGNLDELANLWQLVSATPPDVLHLTGHGDHQNNVPYLAFETLEGTLDPVTAPRLLHKGLDPLPKLAFLSSCRTGQATGVTSGSSLAEQLVQEGWPAVLGWANTVGDPQATRAAHTLYGELEQGKALPLALRSTWVELREKKAKDWHRLRLHCQETIPGPLVTPRGTAGRVFPGRVIEDEFLDPITRQSKVASRLAYVGRRSLTQQAVRQLRPQRGTQVGLLLFGQGGRGKSSTAARICDRLKSEFSRVVVIGVLDETSLIHAICAVLPRTVELVQRSQTLEQLLRNPQIPLATRLDVALTEAPGLQLRRLLFVLDDFEQNQPASAQGNLELAPAAAEVLQTLCMVCAKQGLGRVLITGRYQVPGAGGRGLESIPVNPLTPGEQDKQESRQRQARVVPATAQPLLRVVKQVADGNPRLYEMLFQALCCPGLDHEGLLAELANTAEEFRENVLLRQLVASLPVGGSEMLSRLLIFAEPIPEDLASQWCAAPGHGATAELLSRSVALGLVDRSREGGRCCVRAVRQLTQGDPPIISPASAETATAVAGQALPDLEQLWWNPAAIDERIARELVRLSELAGDRARLVQFGRVLGNWLINTHQAQECYELLHSRLALAGRDPLLLLSIARAAEQLGRGTECDALLGDAGEHAERLPLEERVGVWFWEINRRLRKGEHDAVLRRLRENLVPALQQLDRPHQLAATMCQIANILQARGELEVALRILRKEVLPVFNKLDAVRESAVTMGQIANILQARGELEEALRILREEVLLVFNKLDAVHEIAVTMGRIADIHFHRGELDEALRIRREEELPAYERLGDVGESAVTMGKIADILQARGDLEEALRIRREEVLPVFERLGDVRAKAVTMGKIADILQARGELEAALRIRQEEELPVFERLGDVREKAVTMGKFADILEARGELEEALRMRREEQLPVYERLGDVHSKAVTMGKIADILQARGELDDALRILREEVLPVFNKLDAVREFAVTMGKIADILQARGELEAALRIRQEEELPVYERLGDVRELVVGRVKLAMTLSQRGRAEDAPEIISLLLQSLAEAQRLKLPEATQILEILRQLMPNAVDGDGVTKATTE